MCGAACFKPLSSPPVNWRGPLLAFAIALAIHVAFVFALPESWYDGYLHMKVAANLARDVREGNFHVTQLTSMWLPFFHVSAGLSILVWDDPLISPRLLSAVFGAATIALVCVIARRLGARGWMAALFLAASPLNILFSSYAMTEAATGLFLTLALWAFLKSDAANRWFLWVPVALAPATLSRYEIWPLAFLIWLLAAAQRRASIAAWLASAPLFALPAVAWMALNYASTGDGLHFLHASRSYMFNEFYAANPELAVRNVQKVAMYVLTFFVAGGVPLAYAIFGAIDARDRDRRAVLGFAAGYVAVLVGLYLYRSNVGWLRYWLPVLPATSILAALGVDAISAFLKRNADAALTGVALAGYAVIFVYVLPQTNWSRHYLEIGAYLRDHPPAGRIYCDEVAVQVSSRLPREKFVDRYSVATPTLETLRREGVTDVVWSAVDYSPLRTTLPDPRFVGDLEFDPPANAGPIKKYGLVPAYLYRVR